MNEIDDDDVFDELYDTHPSEYEFEKIRDWKLCQVSDFYRMMKFIESLWWFSSLFVQDGNRYVMSTGGMSSNEDLIRAMEQNRVFWEVCWQSSKRGGHYEFCLPKAV